MLMRWRATIFGCVRVPVCAVTVMWRSPVNHCKLITIVSETCWIFSRLRYLQMERGLDQFCTYIFVAKITKYFAQKWKWREKSWRSNKYLSCAATSAPTSWSRSMSEFSASLWPLAALTLATSGAASTTSTCPGSAGTSATPTRSASSRSMKEEEKWKKVGFSNRIANFLLLFYVIWPLRGRKKLNLKLMKSNFVPEIPPIKSNERYMDISFSCLYCSIHNSTTVFVKHVVSMRHYIIIHTSRWVRATFRLLYIVLMYSLFHIILLYTSVLYSISCSAVFLNGSVQISPATANITR